MAFKNVTSKNPLKRAICDSLRQANGLAPGVGRVTVVKYDRVTGVAQGNVIHKSLGVHYAPVREVAILWGPHRSRGLYKARELANGWVKVWDCVLKAWRELPAYGIGKTLLSTLSDQDRELIAPVAAKYPSRWGSTYTPTSTLPAEPATPTEAKPSAVAAIELQCQRLVSLVKRFETHGWGDIEELYSIHDDLKQNVDLLTTWESARLRLCQRNAGCCLGNGHEGFCNDD